MFHRCVNFWKAETSSSFSPGAALFLRRCGSTACPRGADAMCLGDMKRKAQQGIAINERILEKKRLALWDAVQSKHNPKLPSLSNLLQTKRFKDLSAEYTVNSCAEAILKAIMPSAPHQCTRAARETVLARSGALMMYRMYSLELQICAFLRN